MGAAGGHDTAGKPVGPNPPKGHCMKERSLGERSETRAFRRRLQNNGHMPSLPLIGRLVECPVGVFHLPLARHSLATLRVHP